MASAVPPAPSFRRFSRGFALVALALAELLLMPAPVTWASAPWLRLVIAALALSAGSLVLAAVGAGEIAGYMFHLVGLGALPRTGRRVFALLVIPALALAAAILALLVLSPLLPSPPAAPSSTRTATLLSGGRPLAVGHVLGIAVLEELAFRAPLVLLANVPRLDRPSVLVPAVVVSAAVFGASHAAYGWLNVTHAAVLGLMYGAMAVRFRSLWPSIASHALFDAVALLA